MSQENRNASKSGEFGFFILQELTEDKQREIILKHMASSYKSGIYVSFKPNIDDIDSYMDKLGIKDNLHIVAKKGTKNSIDNTSVFVSTPSFSEMSNLIEKLNSSKGYNFIVLDYVSTLLLHNDSRVIARFLKGLVQKNPNLYILCIGIDSDATSLLAQKISDNFKIFTDFDIKQKLLDEEKQIQKSLVLKKEDSQKFADSQAQPKNATNLNVYSSELGNNSFLGNNFMPVLALASLLSSLFFYNSELNIKLSPGIENPPWYIVNWLPLTLVAISLIILFLYFKNKKS